MHLTSKFLTLCILKTLAAEQGGHVSATQRAGAREVAPHVVREAALRGVDPLLVAAVIMTETGFRVHERGADGEEGPMQVHPRGSAIVGLPRRTVRHLARPDVNVAVGVRHLARLRAMCGGPPDRWLGVYNGARRCGVRTRYTAHVMTHYALLQVEASS